MADSAVRAILLGAPGSGKGTQAELLGKALCVPAISTGEMLRQAVSEKSQLGERVKGTMASGALVDDQLMSEVVRERLSREDADEGFLLDGYPRTIRQAATLDELLMARGESLNSVVLLEVPEAVLVRRAVARRREDDQEKVVRERLRVYQEKTEPLVEHFDRRGLLRRIDGNREIAQVTTAILQAIQG